MNRVDELLARMDGEPDLVGDTCGDPIDFSAQRRAYAESLPDGGPVSMTDEEVAAELAVDRLALPPCTDCGKPADAGKFDEGHFCQACIDVYLARSASALATNAGFDAFLTGQFPAYLAGLPAEETDR